MPDRAPPNIPDHELLRRIGRGGYGEVWLAKSVMGTLRAIKFIFRDTFDSDRPFDREFAGLQRFEPISREHPGLVDVLQIGRNDEAGCFYYVMELADRVDGEELKPESYAPKTLRSEINSKGRLPFGECVQLGLELTSALGYLHKNGLIHRDIKPSNIIFVGHQPKLADIGLVTLADQTKSFVGSPGYLPREGSGTRSADIYSLGKVLYEMSTGGDLEDFPEPHSDLKDSVDRDRWVQLNEVIVRACDEDPRERYQSSDEIHSDLLMLQAGQPVKPATKPRRGRLLARKIAIAASLSLLAAAFIRAVWPFERVLRATRPFGSPAVENWASALLGDFDGDGSSDVFVQATNALKVFSNQGELLNQWRFPPGAQNVNLNLVSNLVSGGSSLTTGFASDEVMVSWSEGTNLNVALLGRGLQVLRRFQARGAIRDGPSGPISQSSMEARIVVDLDHDGRPELLATIGTGYNLKPRALCCFDFERQSLLWQYPIAPSPQGLRCLDLNEDGRLEVVFGTYAVGNGNAENDGTDDSHSYLYGITHDGKKLWTHGDTNYMTFATRCEPLVVDFDGDGKKEVLAWLYTTQEFLEPNHREIGQVIKLDERGDVIARYEAGKQLLSCQAADLDGDGRVEVLVTDRLGFLHIVNWDLSLREKVEVVRRQFDMVDLYLEAIVDLDGDGEVELIFRSSQREKVTGENPGHAGFPPNVRFFHDNCLSVWSSTLKALARFRVAKLWEQQIGFKVLVRDIDGDRRPELLILADKVTALKYQRQSWISGLVSESR
ncbi:MAG: serine/threonine protein kinase [Verrucomicrobia bacterium]|nr:serine/threonine protein kinase [Verrucomicrobiota bacterium]